MPRRSQSPAAVRQRKFVKARRLIQRRLSCRIEFPCLLQTRSAEIVALGAATQAVLRAMAAPCCARLRRSLPPRMGGGARRARAAEHLSSRGFANVEGAQASAVQTGHLTSWFLGMRG